MHVWQMILREIAYRKTTFLLGIVGVALATATLVSALLLLRQHDRETEWILRQKQAEAAVKVEEMRADVETAMRRLGYNAVIIPKDQSLSDWYAEDYAAKCMPEDRAEALADTHGLAERYVPRLRQKLKWTERTWTVIVVGVGREITLTTPQDKAAPLVDEVPAGAVVVGYELHHAMGLEPGAELQLQGRPFRVLRCAGEKGAEDDITIRMNLADAQRLLNKPGRINEILIVEHPAVWGKLETLRERVSGVLPDCQVVEIASKTLAHAHTRIKTGEEATATVERERQSRTQLRSQIGRTAFLLVPIAFVLCGIWTSVLAYINVSERTGEIGTLRALGFRQYQLGVLFLGKYLITGALGGALGAAIGWLACGLNTMEGSARAGWMTTTSGVSTLLAAIPVGILFSLLAAWLPVQRAARLDPPEVLRHE